MVASSGTQVCGIQMCFAQGLGCECEYARVAPADMDVLACGSFICTGQAPLVGWHYIHGPKGPQADVIGTPVGVFLRLYVMCVRASSVNAHAHPTRSHILARAHTLYPHAQSQSRPQVPARRTSGSSSRLCPLTCHAWPRKKQWRGFGPRRPRRVDHVTLRWTRRARQETWRTQFAPQPP